MPPELDDNELESTSSVDTTLDEGDDIRGEGSAVGDNGAESSDAHDEGQGERSTLDVVQDVVKQRDPEAAGSSPEAKKEGEEVDQKGTQAAKEPDDEKFSDVPFHKHPRFQQLLKQRDSLKVDADRYRNVDNFLRQHGVPAEEASQALKWAAMRRADPVALWKEIRPWVQDLLVEAGEVLPQDLKGRVESGELTVEAANELAKERAKSAGLERSRKTEQERAEEQRTHDHITSLRNAANTWEAERSAKDPNFEAKRPKIMKELAWIHTTEGKADTPEKVREQLDRAYKAVGSIAINRKQSAAPAVGAAQRKPAVNNGSASKPSQPDDPTGVLKHIRAVVAQRVAAA